MAEMLIQSESLTAIADEIRVLSDTEDAMSLSAMESHISEANTDIDTEANLISQIVTALEGKTGGGDGGNTSEIDSLIARTISSYTNDRVTGIGQGAFAYASKLQSINLPAATSIGLSAFYRCFQLTTVNLPVATTIGVSAFNYCQNLASINLPAATTMSDYAFAYCSNLTAVSLPMATSIGSTAFGYCSNLTTISFPRATSISGYAFNRCYNLKSLYLTGSSVCNLYASNAFSSTPIGGYSTSAGTYGSIYVPTSLLTSYQNATNWTYFSSRFVGI